jgi:hypothetical protein
MFYLSTTKGLFMLTITKRIDELGLESYSLDGQLTDHDGEPVYVGEFSFKADTIEASAAYYATNFDNVTIERDIINDSCRVTLCFNDLHRLVQVANAALNNKESAGIVRNSCALDKQEMHRLFAVSDQYLRGQQ